MFPSAPHVQMALTVKEPAISNLQDRVILVFIVLLDNIAEQLSHAALDTIARLGHQLKFCVLLVNGKMNPKNLNVRSVQRDISVT